MLMHLPVLALDVGWGTTLAIKTLVVLAIIPAGALILGYVFLLKMMSHMQSRLGPMDPGGFHGWFQLIGDGVKFMQKEDIMTKEADPRVFALAPAVVVLSTFLVFVVIPAGPRLVVAPLDAYGDRARPRCPDAEVSAAVRLCVRSNRQASAYTTHP